jgi:hypothetical protein
MCKRYRGGRLTFGCYHGGRLEVVILWMVTARVKPKDRVVLPSQLTFVQCDHAFWNGMDLA